MQRESFEPGNTLCVAGSEGIDGNQSQAGSKDDGVVTA
jgi:hypothetical protein